MSEEYPYIRIRWKKLGGHVHCRLFTAAVFDGTYAKCGDLTFSEREWDGVTAILGKIEFLPEKDGK